MRRYSLSRFQRFLLYPLISATVVMGLAFAWPHAATAISWGDLIQSAVNFGQAAALSDKQEIKLGQSINDQLVNHQFRLYDNPELNAYVNEVGQRVAAKSDRPNIPYKYQVIDDKNINASATMGGFVYINTGLLKAVSNEAQLAGVLGHETGHIVARHAVKKLKQAALEGGALSLAGVNRNALANLGVQLAINQPSSRGNETEADKKGLVYLARAGYPQSQMAEFMKVFLKLPSPPTFLSTHPSTPERIKVLGKLIDPSIPETNQGMDSAAYKAKIHMLL